ncbi:M56 family metallopeptidase [Stenotrophomonas sp.]|uniref:M56 family metallopeptidase n=1 Tax=Stenotrophomonas sp. TaxID=69392 RepID=UPI0028A2DA9E|nr:M56 family metallopeptidase [Stenotrophomonas sp.]
MDAFATAQLSLAPALASALLHALWQITLLGLGAWLALAATARHSAAMRHAIGMLFLLAMVLVPALTFISFLQMPVPAVDAPPALLAEALGGASASVLLEHVSSSVTMVLALLWVLCVAGALVRHAGGLYLLRTLGNLPFEPMQAHRQQRIAQLAAAMNIRRSVEVRLSKDVAGPCTAHLLKPVIWLPLSLTKRLPRDQMDAVLAHELAHIARLDWLWSGLQCAAESLLFFHPAARWLGHRIREEREHACDDLAAVACGDGIALAEALVQLERSRQPVPRLLLAAHGGSLMKRVTRLLSARSTRSYWSGVAGITLVLAICSVLAVHAGVRVGGMPGVQLGSTDRHSREPQSPPSPRSPPSPASPPSPVTY